MVAGGNLLFRSKFVKMVTVTGNLSNVSDIEQRVDALAAGLDAFFLVSISSNFFTLSQMLGQNKLDT